MHKSLVIFKESQEWIELKNISSETVDLSDWFIGDRHQLYQITSLPTLVTPGAYVILAQNKLTFESAYPDFDDQIIEPVQWPTLNNSDDLIILNDNYNILADQFEYLERIEKSKAKAPQILLIHNLHLIHPHKPN